MRSDLALEVHSIYTVGLKMIMMTIIMILKSKTIIRTIVMMSKTRTMNVIIMIMIIIVDRHFRAKH